MHDDAHCIFHSEDIQGKKGKFNDSFWEEFEKQKKEDKTYDFSGFIFPDSISFNEKKFEKSINFANAEFLGKKTSFIKTKFLGKENNFWDAKFSSEHTNFYKAEFSGELTIFIDVEFSGKIFFSNTEFKSSDTFFIGAEFSGEATEFSEAKFLGKEVDFTGTQFQSGSTKFNNTKFSSRNNIFTKSVLDNVSGLFEALTKKVKFFFIKIKKYNINNFCFILGDKTARENLLINRKSKEALYLFEFKARHPILYFFWWILADCGRSIFRWTLCCVFIAIIFGSLYADYKYPSWLEKIDKFYLLKKINPILEIGRPSHSTQDNDLRKSNWFTPYYMSIVIFTPLGSGNVFPANLAAEIFLVIEVFIGYVMLGGLISIFASKFVIKI